MFDRWLIALVLGLAVLTTSSNASAQDSGGTKTEEEVKKTFKSLSESAQKKYAAGDLEGAIDDFEAAYRIKPVSNILYNVGRIHEKLGNIDEAIAKYEKFIVAPNVEISARQDAVSRIRTLREVRDLQRGEEEGAPDGETDDAESSSTPGVDSSSEGSSAATQGDGPAAVDRTAAWVFLGIGVTSLAGAGVFAFLTSMQHTAFEEASTLEAGREAATRGQTFGYVADGLLAAGVVSSVLGVIFWFTASPEETAVTVSPLVGRDGVGVGMRGSF